MARNSNAMRGLSIAHIVIGILLFSFGIADRVLVFPLFPPLWPSNVYFGIWIGIWMCITGIMGITASGRERTGTGTAFTGVFLGFSVISVLFALAIIGSYGYILAAFWPLYWYFPVRLVIAAALFLLGIAEFIIGIWAAVSGCQACCDNTPPGQVVLAPNPAAGNVMTQGPDGVPVAVPVQAGGEIQGVQLQMMMTSTAGKVTGQPGFNQTSSSETNYTGHPSTQYDIRL